MRVRVLLRALARLTLTLKLQSVGRAREHVTMRADVCSLYK